MFPHPKESEYGAVCDALEAMLKQYAPMVGKENGGTMSGKHYDEILEKIGGFEGNVG